jgi:hypothetical protein
VSELAQQKYLLLKNDRCKGLVKAFKLLGGKNGHVLKGLN